MAGLAGSQVCGAGAAWGGGTAHHPPATDGVPPRRSCGPIRSALPCHPYQLVSDLEGRVALVIVPCMQNSKFQIYQKKILHV